MAMLNRRNFSSLIAKQSGRTETTAKRTPTPTEFNEKSDGQLNVLDCALSKWEVKRNLEMNNPWTKVFPE